MTCLSLFLLVMIMLPDSYSRSTSLLFSPHINIYDEGAVFPFAHISQNEPLSPSNISTVSDQHKPSLLWTSACSTSFTPANRTAI